MYWINSSICYPTLRFRRSESLRHNFLFERNRSFSRFPWEGFSETRLCLFGWDFWGRLPSNSRHRRRHTKMGSVKTVRYDWFFDIYNRDFNFLSSSRMSKKLYHNYHIGRWTVAEDNESVKEILTAPLAATLHQVVWRRTACVGRGLNWKRTLWDSKTARCSV